MALETVSNLLDDLGLTSTKISLIEDIKEEVEYRKFAEEKVEISDDFFFGESAEEFLSELFGI